MLIFPNTYMHLISDLLLMPTFNGSPPFHHEGAKGAHHGDPCWKQAGTQEKLELSSFAMKSQDSLLEAIAQGKRF